MAYAAISKPSLNQNQILYTGDATSSRSITGVGFQPDLVWVKTRSAANPHLLSDVLRGTNNNLQSDSNAAATTSYAQGWVSAFGADGYTAQAGGSGDNDINGSGNTYVTWNWKANGAGSANEDGSINSTVSVNATAGFSIVSYVGDYTAGSTVGHGLGAVPSMYIIKNRDQVEPWLVYHQALGNTKGLYLNTDDTSTVNTVFTNNTSPTSSVLSLGLWGGNNGSGDDLIAYCFADVKGYSKAGSYKGNGNADGPFIYTGFKPSFVMIKNDGAGSTPWFIFDDKRNPSNETDLKLNPNSDAAEASANPIDILSNGFKLRTSGSYNNGSGNLLVYMAFAAEPLVANVGSGLPATAH